MSDKKFSLSLGYTYRHSDELYNNSNEITNASGEQTTFHRFSINGAYRISDNFTLSSSIPFVDGLREENGVPDKTISGLGDISVSVMWSPFTKSTSSLKGLSFNGGFTLPTGDPADQPLVGVANPSVFQLGTGAYQLTLGTNYTWENGDWSYRLDLNTTLPLNESSENFKPAAMYYGSLSAGRSINDELSFRLGLNVSYLEDDQFNGADLVTGYTSIAAKLRLTWQINDEYALSSSVSVPVYRDVNQTQIAAGTLFQLGVSRSF